MTLKEGFSNYPKILISSLIISIITAIFSIGYNNPDEHWQINEFAAYKLKLSSYQDMPWELHRQSRQTIKPSLVYLVSKFFMNIGLFNPFCISLIFRIISSLLAFWATNLLVFQSRDYFKSEKAFTFCLYTSNLLWFIPYIHARFQGENWSSIFLTLGVYLLIESLKQKKWILFLLTGLLLGFSFNFRFQVGFSIFAIGLWLLVYQKINFSNSFITFLGFVVAISISTLIDTWYYANFLFMPYKYYQIQIVENVVSNWEIYPWWYYNYMFLEQVVPPLSLVLFLMYFISIFYNINSLFVWILTFFIVGHSFVGHKEIRFLIPMLSFFSITVFYLFNQDKIFNLYESLSGKKWFKYLLKFIIIQNLILLFITSVKPANEIVGLLNFLYNESKSQKTLLLYTEKDPFDWGGLKYNFYKNGDLLIKPFNEVDISTISIDQNLKVLIIDPHFENTLINQTQNTNLIYCTIPSWLGNFNFNNWLSRARIWNVYEVNFKKK